MVNFRHSTRLMFELVVDVLNHSLGAHYLSCRVPVLHSMKMVPRRRLGPVTEYLALWLVIGEIPPDKPRVDGLNSTLA